MRFFFLLFLGLSVVFFLLAFIFVRSLFAFSVSCLLGACCCWFGGAFLGVGFGFFLRRSEDAGATRLGVARCGTMWNRFLICDF